MAGFQGVTDDNRITTLGRGGSDTSAVSFGGLRSGLIAAIFIPTWMGFTRPIPHRLGRTQNEMRVLRRNAGTGLARRQGLTSALGRNGHALPHADSGFIDIRQRNRQRSARHFGYEGNEKMGRKHRHWHRPTRDEAKITLVKVADRPGVAAQVFVPLARAGVNVDMIVQTASEDSRSTDISFTVNKQEFDRAMKVLEEEKAAIGYDKMVSMKNVCKISLVGIGMRSHVGVAATMFETLAEKGINILVIETSEINTSVLIADEYTELALRSLHTAYGLDAGVKDRSKRYHL